MLLSLKGGDWSFLSGGEYPREVGGRGWRLVLPVRHGPRPQAGGCMEASSVRVEYPPESEGGPTYILPRSLDEGKASPSSEGLLSLKCGG